MSADTAGSLTPEPESRPLEDVPLTVADEPVAQLEERIGVPPARLLVMTLGFLLATAVLFLFGFLADDVYRRQTVSLDASANEYLHSYKNPVLDFLMNLATALGSFEVLLLVYVVALVWLARRGRRREVVFLTVALAGGFLLNDILKDAFERVRPSVVWATPIEGYSFPSGHSMHSLVFYLALALVIWLVLGRRAGTVAFVLLSLLVLAVGMSRIYLGQHYLSDVIGGFVAGFLWLVAAATAVEGGRTAFVVRRRR